MKVFVIGASNNPDRYSYIAARMLVDHGHEITLLALREDLSGEFPILKSTDLQPDQVTLYVGPKNQSPWMETVLQWKPEKVIFNPGTENSEFQARLSQAGIQWEEACTLVLLQTGQWS